MVVAVIVMIVLNNKNRNTEIKFEDLSITDQSKVIAYMIIHENDE